MKELKSPDIFCETTTSVTLVVALLVVELLEAGVVGTVEVEPDCPLLLPPDVEPEIGLPEFDALVDAEPVLGLLVV